MQADAFSTLRGRDIDKALIAQIPGHDNRQSGKSTILSKTQLQGMASFMVVRSKSPWAIIGDTGWKRKYRVDLKYDDGDEAFMDFDDEVRFWVLHPSQHGNVGDDGTFKEDAKAFIDSFNWKPANP